MIVDWLDDLRKDASAYADKRNCQEAELLELRIAKLWTKLNSAIQQERSAYESRFPDRRGTISITPEGNGLYVRKLDRPMSEMHISKRHGLIQYAFVFKGRNVFSDPESQVGFMRIVGESIQIDDEYDYANVKDTCGWLMLSLVRGECAEHPHYQNLLSKNPNIEI